MICAICGFEHNNSVRFAKHVHSVHNLTSQEYYDKYILKTLLQYVQYVMLNRENLKA